MSRPSWDALADRYGAQQAAYRACRDAEEYFGDICEFCGAETAEDCHCANTERAYEQTRSAVDLLTLARAHRDAGAAQDGQATVQVAVGAWLALVMVCAALALCVYGAAWIDGAWLAPVAGLAR